MSRPHDGRAARCNYRRNSIGPRRIEDINAFIDEVLACADPLTLQRPRKTVKLHRSDVRLRVMSDDNRLDNAWGGEFGAVVHSTISPGCRGQ